MSLPKRSFARIFGLVGAGTALAALAGPVGLPGLALVLAVVLLPALALSPNAALALMPLAAVPLGAAGAIAAAPAAAAFAAHNAKDRAVLGALSFGAYLIAAIGFGFGDRLKIAPQAEAGWASSAPDAVSEVLAAFTDPSALGGIVICAVAAVILGMILRAHPALALVGTVIWAAALAAGLGYVGDEAQSASAAIAIVVVALAVAARAAVNRREEPARPPALASAQPALPRVGFSAQKRAARAEPPARLACPKENRHKRPSKPRSTD